MKATTLKAVKDALRFYADDDTYVRPDDHEGKCEPCFADAGDRASAALALLDAEEGDGAHASKLVASGLNRQLECSCGFRTTIADGFDRSIFDIEDEFRAHLSSARPQPVGGKP